MDVGVVSSDEDEMEGVYDMTLDDDQLDSALIQTQHGVVVEFEEYIEAHSPIKRDEEDKLRQLDEDAKWKTIHEEQGRAPIYSAKHYVDALKEHIDGTKKPRPAFRKSQDSSGGAGTLTNLLTKLKLDLKMSHDSFLEDFIKPPNNGVSLLFSVLKDIQKDLGVWSKRGKEALSQAIMDEYYTLLCIKFTMRSEKALQYTNTNDNLNTVACCICSTNMQTKKLVLQILTLACNGVNGYQEVTSALISAQIKAASPFRFKVLVGSLNESEDLAYKALCVRFFNALWRSTDNSNTKVHLQQELTLAGFDPMSLGPSSLLPPNNNELKQEVDQWKRNFIEVSGSRHKLFELETRNSQLRNEVDRLQIRIHTAEKETEKAQQSLLKSKDKSDKYRERAAELQDTITKLTDLYRERTGLNPEEEVNLEEAIKSLDAYGTTRTPTSTASRPTIAAITEPPALPPAPPLPRPISETLRKKVTPRVSLPMLNWTPMTSTKDSIFEAIDDRAVLRELDFSKFEMEFQLPNRQEGMKSKEKRDEAIKQYQNQIHFVQTNRAKNMIITKTRIAKGVQQRLYWEDPLSARDIKDAIENCDLEIVPGEYAELLLKYIPTKDEVDKLARNSKMYALMGEAEQFLFHLAQIERLEAKLSMMAFIGVFGEIVSTLVPQIDSVCHSSLSVLNSAKLRKVFEIILAYGNYMNSCKRGYVLGFKLESLDKLQDVKSWNREKTLIHHFVELLDDRYPDLSNFYDDLNITVHKGVSYQALASDMHGLRKGIDLVKYEMEKQPTNAILQTFHSHASMAIAKVAESFHKMEDAYKKVCNVHGESAKKSEPDEFFGHITNFVNLYKKAATELKRRPSTASSPPISPTFTAPITSPTNQVTMVRSRTIDFTSEANTIVARTREERIPVQGSSTAKTSLPSPTLLNGSIDDEVFPSENHLKDIPFPDYAVPSKLRETKPIENGHVSNSANKQFHNLLNHHEPQSLVSEITITHSTNHQNQNLQEPSEELPALLPDTVSLSVQPTQIPRPKIKKNIGVREKTKLVRTPADRTKERRNSLQLNGNHKIVNGINGNHDNHAMSPKYEEQLSEAISSLDQVLDDEDRSPINRSDSTRL